MDMIQDVISAEKQAEKQIEKAQLDLAKAYATELSTLAQHAEKKKNELLAQQAKELDTVTAKLEADFAQKKAKMDEQIAKYGALSDKKLKDVSAKVLKLLHGN